MGIEFGDVETIKKDEKGDYQPILDATGKYMILGCLVNEKGVGKTFRNREEMYRKR